MGISSRHDVLGFNAQLVVGTMLFGFLGSFVMILVQAMGFQYTSTSSPTLILYGLLRPVAGAAMGLFVMAIFVSSFIGIPIENPNQPFIGAINKADAFIFAAAFVSGLVDGFVVNLASRFSGLFRGHREENSNGTVPAQQPAPPGNR